MDQSLIKRAMNGKTLVLKYKKGGKIDRERVYNSNDTDPETIMAIGVFLSMYARDKMTNKTDLSPNIIGNPVIGLLPWTNFQETIENLQKADAEGRTKDAEAIRFDFSTPLRVADVREGTNDTIYVDMESS